METSLGAQLSALRKREIKTCDCGCGQEFLALKKQRFYSTNCRVRAFQKARKLTENSAQSSTNEH